MKIVIDPGHGGSDPGAVGLNNTKESQIVFDTSTLLQNKLSQLGHTVLITRTDDNTYPSLSDRCDLANSNKADFFISLHCNAATNREASGIEVWTSEGETASDPIAKTMTDALVNYFNVQEVYHGLYHPDRGAKEEDYKVLRSTHMPAVLVEMEFISNPEMETFLSSKTVQQGYADCLANVIDGIKL